MPLVIADTSVWVRSFRVRDSVEKREMERLIQDHEVAMVGVVYTELLRGARDERELRTLEETLSALTFVEAGKETWLNAGRLLYGLRRRGLIIPLADAVIAAQALEGDHQLYTLDDHFRRVPGLRLYEAEIK